MLLCYLIQRIKFRERYPSIILISIMPVFPNAARNRDSAAICRVPLFVHRLNPISSEILAKRQRPLCDGTSVILIVKFRLGELESLWTSKRFIFHVSTTSRRTTYESLAVDDRRVTRRHDEKLISCHHVDKGYNGKLRLFNCADLHKICDSRSNVKEAHSWIFSRGWRIILS